MANRSPTPADGRGGARRDAGIQAYFDAVAGHRGGHPYASLLGFRTFDSAGLHRKVREGFSYSALERFRRTADLSAAEVGAVLQIPERTFHRRKIEGRLRADESDRLLRFTRLFGKALELFEGDAGAARAWLEHPLAALGGARPIELARTDPGAGAVEDVIGRLEHGVFP